ncbi:MAG: hypothetical protein ACNFW9_04305 [Candidatus Kerfeldbacteria bacterium]
MNKSSSDNMTLIGTVDALYYDLQCVGVKVTGIGFEKGAKLCFKLDDSGENDSTIITDSIEIDHQQVTEVKVGDQCGIKIGSSIGGQFKVGMKVYHVVEEDDGHSRQNVGTDNELQDGKKI